MGWFRQKSLRRIRNAIAAIRAGEYNMHFSTDKLRGEDRMLTDELNEAIADMRDRMNRQERIYGSFEAILNQVDAALLAINDTGKVMWMNKKAITGLCGYAIDDISMLVACDPSLPGIIAEMLPGQQRLVSLSAKGHATQIKIAMVRYIQGGEAIRLYTIENIQQVMQQSENEAQNKLVSVLTHEIMNSLSPIISLSETLLHSIKEGEKIADQDNLLAVEAISRRSRGLLSFVESYRKLSRLSLPQLSWVKVGELIDGIECLLSDAQIEYLVEDREMQLNIDRQQIEQVLLNLLKNATEACSDTDSPCIAIKASSDHANRLFLITVSDNGRGICPEILSNIFTPFFTTKPNGSGIGLSISRQIIINHNGLIKVTSSPGKTDFTIQLPLIYKYDD